MSLSYGLLGLLNYFPMSGYDLKKMFDDSINFFWAAQTSQIYRELKALEKKGDVAARVRASGKGPNKRVYEITKQGRISLKQWLDNPPEAIGEDQRNAFLVRVLHSSEIGFKKLHAQVQARLDAYRKELRQLGEVEHKLGEYLRLSGKEENLPYWKIVLSRGGFVTRANIQWAEETMKYLKQCIKKGRP
jgi:PadR family transcriptional regulator, regulatory protein AphA